MTGGHGKLGHYVRHIECYTKLYLLNLTFTRNHPFDAHTIHTKTHTSTISHRIRFALLETDLFCVIIRMSNICTWSRRRYIWACVGRVCVCVYRMCGVNGVWMVRALSVPTATCCMLWCPGLCVGLCSQRNHSPVVFVMAAWLCEYVCLGG